MHRIFLPVYRYFASHRALMYVLMAVSFLVFAFFGLKLRYEEDIVKLLPRSSTSNELAFSDIDLKDKVFIQVTSRDASKRADSYTMQAALDAFCDSLLANDGENHIAGILNYLDADLAFQAMDFGLSHLPTFMDTAWYSSILEKLAPEAIDAQMEVNLEMVMNDETGTASQLVAMDPLNLREVLLGRIVPDGGTSIGGYTMEGGHLFCPDKSVVLAFLSPNFDPMDSGASTRFAKQMGKIRSQIEADYPEIRILYHGNPLGSVSNAGTIKRDLAWTIGLSLLVILLIMILSFHSFAFVWQQVVPILYGTAFSLACMYWIKGYMSLMALGISSIVLGVAISYCLHVLIHYYYVGDAEVMLREESTPVFLGCLTTVGAFMGLLFTESDLLRDFGLFATFALIGNTLYALVFLPHFLRKKQIRFKRSHGFPVVEKFNSLPWDSSKWIIGAMLVLVAVGVAFSPKVRFDSDLRNLDYDEPSLCESQDLYNEKNADGAMHFYFAAYDQELDNALEYNKGLFEGLDSLSRAGLVKSYTPLTSLLFHSNADQELRIAAWKEFWSPSRVAALRGRIAAAARRNGLQPSLFEPFFAMLEADYEPGDLYNSGIVPPGLMSNYIERQDNGRFMVFTDVAFDEKDKDTVTDALVEKPNVLVLEPFYYCRDMVEIVHDDFSTTLWISSLFVLLVLLISFRNVIVSLVAFLPMFASWYVMQGYMALIGLEFNLINIVISTFIYGIGVDYSIFVMEGLLQEARTGKNDMLQFHKVAIFYSAMVLAIVTFSLIFATHPAIKSIGIITLIGMASTILLTYSLEPWVFRLLLRIPSIRNKI